MDRKKMNDAIADSRNALEAIYRAGYDAGRDDAEKEAGTRYAVNVLDELAHILRGEVEEYGYSSYVAWVALKAIDDMKDYIWAGGGRDD